MRLIWSRVVISLYISSILPLAAEAAASPFDCESRLTASVAMMMGRKLKTPSVQRRSIGAPSSQIYAAAVRGQKPIEAELQKLTISTHIARENQIFLMTDMGPTIWLEEELEEWRALDRYLKFPQVAVDELNRIADHKDYCTPGILPALCQALRASREARRTALKKTLSAMNRADGLRAQAEAMQQLIHQTSYEHESKDLLRFPWGTQASAFPDRLEAFQAQAIFANLARETLLRHLVFQGLDIRPHLGSELSLDTRVGLAAIPALVQLAPFYLEHPLDLPRRFTIGDLFHDLTLLEIDWKALPVRASLDVSVNFEPSVLKLVSASFNIDTDQEGFTKEKAFAMKDIVDRELNSAAKDFAEYARLKSPIEISTSWDTLEILDVKISGLSRMNQILFYYYLQDRAGRHRLPAG